MEKIITQFSKLSISSKNGETIDENDINNLAEEFSSLSLDGSTALIEKFESLSLEDITDNEHLIRIIQLVRQAVKTMLCKPKCISVNYPIEFSNYIF